MQKFFDKLTVYRCRALPLSVTLLLACHESEKKISQVSYIYDARYPRALPFDRDSYVDFALLLPINLKE